MPRNDARCVAFAQVVATYYHTTERYVHAALDYEFERLLALKKCSRTAQAPEQALQEALVNCRRWLTDKRREIHANDLFIFSHALLFFRGLRRKESEDMR